MAALYVPSNELEVHPNFRTAYQEDAFKRRDGLRKRQSYTNWTIDRLQDVIGFDVWNSWKGLNVNMGRRVPYANYLAHTNIERVYVTTLPVIMSNANSHLHTLTQISSAKCTKKSWSWS